MGNLLVLLLFKWGLRAPGRESSSRRYCEVFQGGGHTPLGLFKYLRVMAGVGDQAGTRGWEEGMSRRGPLACLGWFLLQGDQLECRGI